MITYDGVAEICRVTERVRYLPVGSVRVTRAEIQQNLTKTEIVNLIGQRTKKVDQWLTAEFGPVLRKCPSL